MNKIVILGPPGAGKTEFANTLGQILEIENVYHLDYFFWKCGENPTEWVPADGRDLIIEEKTKASKWIIEGNFLETLDTQFAHADRVIWINLNPFLCFYRVLKRYLSYMGKEIPEIAPGCRDKLTLRFLVSIFRYRFFDSQKITDKLQRENSPAFIVLKTPRAVASFLDEMRLLNAPQ
jgi:adenylate kinase family enzyme